jgi:uncharacterized membrane protein YqiK
MIQKIISSPLFDPISLLVSLFIGAIITWLVSKRFYIRSSKEAGLILLAIEKAGQFELKRDNDGKIVGLVLHLSGKAELKGGGDVRAVGSKSS